jgi:phage tail sheath protein FI
VESPPEFSDQQIYRIQAALVAHCEEKRDRLALLDPPLSAARDDESGAGAVLAWRSRFDSSYAALVYPWARVIDPLGGGVRDVPPAGFVAGLYARTDVEVGVHKAPANAELRGVAGTTVFVNEAMQGGLNPRGINAIRSFPGRGVVLYGARTVSSNPDLRFVNVRRLLMMIERALYLATQWAVFEPNDVYTQHKIRLSIATFLETLWRRGALAGAQADQAFFVKCDEDNNPPTERDQGRLLAEVGVAPTLPGEFIVLRLGIAAEETEIETD